METKEIIFLVVLFALSGYSLYRRYAKKNAGTLGNSKGSFSNKSSLNDQADDYEPYSGRKDKGV
jgi:hypothetical protein